MKFGNGFNGAGPEGTGDVKRRLWMLSALVVLVFAVLALRLWYLQIIRGKYYRELSENNRVRIVNIRPPRGVLYDRNGIPLAANTPSYTIIFTPEDAKGDASALPRLAGIIGLSKEELEERVRSEENRNPYSPIRVKENASFEEVSKVEAHRDDLPGVMVQVELRRSYPYGEFASHLIGYIGKITPAQQKIEEYEGLPPDFLVGQYGIEKAYDKIIRGEAGRKGVEVDAMGRQIRTIYTVDPVAGDDLLTTLDYKAQKAADEALQGESGAIVALDPMTGDVLAMASRPGFDPNIFPLGLTPSEWKYLTQDPGHPLNNRALQGQFPPGSTFKLAMALAGLETGKADLTRTENCPGSWFFGSRLFHCWQKKGHHIVALHKAIVESCDVYFYKLGNMLGIDNIARYCGYLGLGQPTGIGLQEKRGLIPSTEWKRRARHEEWYPGETISCAIGQGYVSVTPIQLARMAATITNGGVLMQPQVVRGIRYKDGRLMVFPAVTLGRAPVRKANLDIVREGMRGVVEEPGGTAHGAKSEHVTIGGKTGTAQVIGLGKGKGKQYQDHAWFVAVAPLDDPKIAVCVLVEHGGHGGSVSAPLAKKVIEAYLRVDEESLKEKQALANRTSVLKNRTGVFKNRTTAANGKKKALANRTTARAAKKKALANRTTARKANKKVMANRTTAIKGKNKKEAR